MTTVEPFTLSRDDLLHEIQILKRGLLHWFLIIAQVFAWCWFPLTMFRGWKMPTNLIAIGILFAGGIATLLWWRRGTPCSYKLACWTLLLSCVIAQAFMVVAHPGSTAMAFGVVLIIAANALLNPRAAAVVALFGWLGVNAAQPTNTGLAWIDFRGTADVLLLYGLCWGAIVAGQ